jgi:hypothetical protein
MSMPVPAPLVFCSSPFDGDLPFQAWADLSLEIDGQPEHDENLLNLAGFLVRQALVDQQPERLKQASDVESALYGLRAHVQLYSGGCFNFAEALTEEDQPSPEVEVIPGISIGNLLLLAKGAAHAGIEALHRHLKPVDALANALQQAQESGLSQPAQHVCALLPGMTITLTPPFADSQTLIYPSRLDTYQQQLKLEELAGLPQQRCEILLGDQLLDETQPAYGIAYDILSMMLRLLRQRALESEQPDLSARQQEWQRVRLVIGSGLHYSAQFMLNPETYQPAFGNAMRGLKLAGTQSILLPDHLDLPALEQVWEALAHEDMLVEWQRVQASKDVADRSLMLNLEVACKLEVLAIDADGQLQVLESYRDSEFISEPAAQQAAAPVPEAEQTPAQVPALAADAAKVEQQATRPHDDLTAPRKSGSYGPLLLAAVIVATLTVILLRG